MINSDPTVRNVLKIVFLPNYSVSLAEIIIPAADLSEQISTAGMEASGTGNMKFALNGALTIGTLDGANIEILERVGDDNMFIFGLTADQVEARRRSGIDSSDLIAASPVLAEVLSSVHDGVFSPDEPDRYRGLVNSLRYHDHFLVCADFDDYLRDAAADRRSVAQAGRLVAGVHPQYRECRVVLLRSLDPRICRADLERAGLRQRTLRSAAPRRSRPLNSLETSVARAGRRRGHRRAADLQMQYVMAGT